MRCSRSGSIEPLLKNTGKTPGHDTISEKILYSITTRKGVRDRKTRRAETGEGWRAIERR
jgi:hypothetical protein